jgi:ring-1,2-phenylacetyl-CoA epoxidase subunit PaaD
MPERTAPRDHVPHDLTVQRVMEALDDVKDPEIPVVSVVELGIIQHVAIDGGGVTVAITPTFSGCPALHVMRAEIEERVLALGAASVDVPVVLDPPWTSDKITPAARERMREIGLAPPPPAGPRFQADLDLMLMPSGPPTGRAELVEPEPPVPCPFCGSRDTSVENPFGPTICRSIHYCNACQQPFEQFKAL